MNRKLGIRISIFTLFLLFFIGVGTYFFTGLSARQKVSEINLYSLVPSNSIAVFETSNVTLLVKELKKLSCSKIFSTLKLSHIVNDLMEHFDQLVDPMPHGLSSSMNKVLISFHSLGSELDQVVYCCTTPEDEEWIEQQIHKKRPIAFPRKDVSYKGETLEIYPMGGDLFLCCYQSPGFFVASYSKKLIEQVIDTHISGHSILSDPVFGLTQDKKRAIGIASLYLKMQQTGWNKLDMKFDGDAIYLSGISVDADTSSSFVNALKEQYPITNFSGNEMPRSTYYISQMAISQLQYIAVNTARREYALATYPDEVKEMDIHMMHFLKKNTSGSLTAITFYPEDSVRRPLSLLSIPVKEAAKAEADLQLFLQNITSQIKIPTPGAAKLLQVGTKSYLLYPLPRNTVFSQLSGIEDTDLTAYALFYRNRLLLAPEPVSILSYITQLENANVIGNEIIYQECVSRLAPHFNYMVMANLSEVSSHPESKPRFIPSFFFQYGDFFSHFILSTQFVCNEGVIYPNITLTYKGHDLK